MNHQRLVHTFLPDGAEEDGVPRVRDIALYMPILNEQ